MFDSYLYHNKATSGAGTAYPSEAPEIAPDFSGIRVTRSLVLCVCFVNSCLSFCSFYFGHCVVFFFDLLILITPLVSSNSSFFSLFIIYIYYWKLVYSFVFLLEIFFYLVKFPIL